MWLSQGYAQLYIYICLKVHCYIAGNAVSIFMDSRSYGPGHTTAVYTDVWVELQWRKGSVGVGLPYSPRTSAVIQPLPCFLP